MLTRGNDKRGRDISKIIKYFRQVHVYVVTYKKKTNTVPKLR